MPLTLLPSHEVSAMRAAGPRVRARLSWLRENIQSDAVSPPFPIRSLAAGALVACVGCPDCLEVYAAADADLSTDWEVF